MRFFIPLAVFILMCMGRVQAQGFPNPATLSTGQGTPGTNDPIWTVSGWYSTNPPNPMGLTYSPALINNNCAPGSWVDPASLPPPTNNGNWITGASACNNNTNDGYLYFRLILDLPFDCNGNSVATSGSYTLYLSGYVDNTITDVFVNGTSTGINGGSFQAGNQLNFSLSGPWVPGTNYIDVQVYNFPNGGSSNPYGLLLVANSAASSVADGDQDGIADINDLCPCEAGDLNNGCVSVTTNGDTVICNGESTTLTAVGSGTYMWNNGATTPSITVSPTANTRYSVVVTAYNGYQDSSIINVLVNQPPVVSISPAAIAICPGGSATLTGNGAAGYLWSTSAIGNSITVSPAGTTTYTVTGADANTCTASASATVTINPLPVAAINPTAVAICAGGSTILTASGGTGYSWSNGGNTAAISVSPTTTTTYNVTVTDANTCTASAGATVTVNPLPPAAINPATTAVCIGNSTTLTASGGTGYAWASGETTAAITVTPPATANYSVTVTDANTCSATASASVTVNQLPTPSVNPATVAICSGTSTQLTATGGNFYVWSNAANTDVITVSPVADTNYDVTVTDANGCSATASATVTVNALPVATISPAGVTICNGATTTLTASGGLTYSWSDGSANAAITVSPATTTAYTVTVSDANTCTASASETVTVVPTMALSTVATDASCTGNGDGSINLTVTSGQSPYSYLWNIPAATNEDPSGLVAGSYTVTVTDNAQCTATTSATVNEPTALTHTSSLTNPFCPNLPDNGTITLSPSGGTGPYTYTWSGTNTGGSQVANAAPGNYAVTISDANNCTVSDAFTLAYLFDFTIQATPDASIKLGESITLGYTLTGTAGNVTNVWGPAATLSCTDCTAPIATPNVKTVYTIEVANDSGCTATSSVTIIVEPDYSLFVPTAFTPNNDGNNDVFSINFGTPQSIAFLEVSIFNRIGEKVFESQDHTFAWDGTYKGVAQQPAVYTWQLKLTFLDGHREEVRKGTVTLLK